MKTILCTLMMVAVTQAGYSAEPADAWTKPIDLSTNDYVQSLAFSPDEKFLAVGIDSNVDIYRADGTVITNVTCTGGFAIGLSFSGDGKRLLVEGCLDGADLFDTATWSSLKRRLDGNLDLSADGRFAFGNNSVWDLNAGKEPKSVFSLTGAEVTLLTHDGQHIVTAKGGTVGVWDAATGKLIREFAGHQADICLMALSADDQLLAVVGHDKDDRAPRVYRLRDGERVAKLKTVEYFRQLQFAPDGKRLVAVSNLVEKETDKHIYTVGIWDIATGKRTTTVAISREWTQMTLSAQGTLAYSTDQRTIQFLKLK